MPRVSRAATRPIRRMGRSNMPSDFVMFITDKGVQVLESRADSSRLTEVLIFVANNPATDSTVKRYLSSTFGWTQRSVQSVINSALRRGLITGAQGEGLSISGSSRAVNPSKYRLKGRRW